MAHILSSFAKEVSFMKKFRRCRAFPLLLYGILILCGLLSACSAVGRPETETNLPTFTQPTQPPDLEAPVIAGVQSFETYQEDALFLTDGITVTDNRDPAPHLEVDDSRLDVHTPGVYPVYYTALDSAGNLAETETTVTVLEKEEGYASIPTIEERADSILAQIITDDMDTRAQVQAIYDWAHSGIGYCGHSDKSDWRQAAWMAMTSRSGDCFNYFAVCKLFFDRLGIPNLDVRKVKNYDGDSDHFWSLVSVDGGETWYHFDATPRIGGGDFCLVTDDYLDGYSAAHKGSHNRDKTLYPATPEK